MLENLQKSYNSKDLPIEGNTSRFVQKSFSKDAELPCKDANERKTYL